MRIPNLGPGTHVDNPRFIAAELSVPASYRTLKVLTNLITWIRQASLMENGPQPVPSIFCIDPYSDLIKETCNIEAFLQRDRTGGLR